MVSFTGDLSYIALGRFRGLGRWIQGWIHVDVPEEYIWPHKKPDASWKGEVEISQEFYCYLLKIARKIVKNKYQFCPSF